MRVAILCFAVLTGTAAGGLHAQAHEGEKLFEARCAKCHTVEKLAPDLARRAPAARERYLERFLQRHYAPDAGERKQISAWLSGQIGATR